MATHSSTLAWKIPWTEEPGRLQSMGLLRVRHDWATSLSFFTFHFHALEKEMAAHSSVLAWRSPGTGEPGGLPSMGLHRVGHDWSDLAAVAAAAIPFSRGSSWPLDRTWVFHIAGGSFTVWATREASFACNSVLIVFSLIPNSQLERLLEALGHLLWPTLLRNFLGLFPCCVPHDPSRSIGQGWAPHPGVASGLGCGPTAFEYLNWRQRSSSWQQCRPPKDPRKERGWEAEGRGSHQWTEVLGWGAEARLQDAPDGQGRGSPGSGHDYLRVPNSPAGFVTLAMWPSFLIAQNILQ